MKHNPILPLLLATTALISSNVYADQNFVLCVSPQYSKGITLEYNSDDSGCVVDDHTNNNFSESNKSLVKGRENSGIFFEGGGINTTLTGTVQEGDTAADGSGFNINDLPHGQGPIITDGVILVPYTVVFESAHKVLGIVAHGNCNIRSERAERVAINVLKDGNKISAFTCYHPDNLSNTYCQQTENSDDIGIAFTKAQSESLCTSNDDISDSVSVLIYPTD